MGVDYVNDFEFTEYNVLQWNGFIDHHRISNKFRKIIAIQKAIQLDIIIECHICEILWHCKRLQEIGNTQSSYSSKLYRTNLIHSPVLLREEAILYRNVRSVYH